MMVIAYYWNWGDLDPCAAIDDDDGDDDRFCSGGIKVRGWVAQTVQTCGHRRLSKRSMVITNGQIRTSHREENGWMIADRLRFAAVPAR